MSSSCEQLSQASPAETHPQRSTSTGNSEPKNKAFLPYVALSGCFITVTGQRVKGVFPDMMGRLSSLLNLEKMSPPALDPGPSTTQLLRKVAVGTCNSPDAGG